MLGKTSLKVSEIGLGTEYLVRQPEETIIETLHAAIESGMNYVDILFFNSTFLEALKQILATEREKLILSCHIGAGMKDGKHKKLRSKIRAKESFEAIRNSLGIDQFETVIIQFVGAREYDKIMAPQGLIRYAREVKETQQAKYLGISTHDPATAVKAIESGEFDLLMTQFNLLALKMPERLKLIDYCHKSHIGLVVIKPFAGGLLLSRGKKVKIPGYKSGGVTEIYQIPSESTALRNLAFILNTAGVSTVIPGVRTKKELYDNMRYYNLTLEERDCQSLIHHFS
ncbi:MAG: aldo/keto reductase [Candidatus Hodarchaeales archaeon]|jgi:predicted aldo/keto reductase-like oxidoreductase